MKRFALVGLACVAIAGVAVAGEGRDRSHDGRGWGWGPNVNIILDGPLPGTAASATEDPHYEQCRDARHGCFGRWGIEEPAYSQCLRDNGC